MPRVPRHHSPGATYHVICRGNHQQPIFDSEADYRYFCKLLGEGVERFDHKIVAYCLMTNHLHMAIRVGETELSPILHNLLFRYAQGYNVKHGTVGHLFQGRFKSKLIDSLGYFRGLIRYIHFNPVKAHIVKRPEHYSWSSHRAYLGQEGAEWLSSEIGLECFGGPQTDEVSAYRRFASVGPAANESFDFDIGELAGSLGMLVDRVAEEFGMSAEDLLEASRAHRISQARGCAALLARRLKGISLIELADHFGVAPSSLCRAASRLEHRLASSPDLEVQISRLQQKLTPLS
jgi:REP-associated tyrosine transposase